MGIYRCSHRLHNYIGIPFNMNYGKSMAENSLIVGLIGVIAP